MNQKMWAVKAQSLTEAAHDFDRRSPALELLEHESHGDEWRSMWLMKAVTLRQRQDGTIHVAGPLLLGIRYHKLFLAEAPHPMEIVTVLHPARVFHPNCSPSGAICLGHPLPGLSLETILHQTWAGLTFNMGKVNTVDGEILNVAAAHFVRANAERFPLTHKGIFEDARLESVRHRHFAGTERALAFVAPSVFHRRSNANRGYV